MKRITAAALAALWSAALAAADEESRRDLGAHEHGRGALNVAVEGDSVWIEFEAPGADIVGFEHEAESAEDRAAVDAAREALSRPLSLFALPEAAGCMVESAEVEAVGGEHEDHDDHGDHGDHGDEEEDEPHGEFHAEYLLRCAAIGEIRTMEFPYFAAFPNAEALEVSIVSGKGQGAFEATRESPAADVARWF